jgi:hypothetical protein
VKTVTFHLTELSRRRIYRLGLFSCALNIPVIPLPITKIIISAFGGETVFQYYEVRTQQLSNVLSTAQQHQQR